jgi:hypothetical protein
VSGVMREICSLFMALSMSIPATLRDRMAARTARSGFHAQQDGSGKMNRMAMLTGSVINRSQITT